MNPPIKFFIVAAIAFSSVVGLSSNASANTIVIDYGMRHFSDGGEFKITGTDFANPGTMGYATTTTSSGGSPGSFETFCVETNQYFSPGSTYYYSISQVASPGGVGGGSPDPLSLGTAWLYLGFAHGTLAGYDYSTLGGGSTSAADLQNTIWWLEGEVADPGAGNIFRNAVITQFGSAAQAMADNNGFYGVGILDLWGAANHTSPAQDQLVLVPDSGTTAILLSLGLLGLKAIHRRRRSIV